MRRPAFLRSNLPSLLWLGAGAAVLALAAACDSSPGDGDAPDGGGGDGNGTAGANGSGGAPPFGDCTPPSARDELAPREDTVAKPTEALGDSIVVDQFGYLPDAEKIAVVRDPVTGFDAATDYTPASSYDLVDATSGEVLSTLTPTAWGGGATHDQSGDRAWWLDFSSVTTPGVYYLRDPDAGTRSDVFRISADAYDHVLVQAVRTFFYQRAGQEKLAEHVGAAWADGASHVGPLQDRQARPYDAPNDASQERDLSGGWYDAGDYNKYSAWTADYVAQLLRAYEEKPAAFGDDYGLPHSGNCIPDIVDEARFGLEHLIRLQEPSGGVLSIVDLDHASPPSAATGPSLYGPVSTNATLRAALAFSAGARLFAEVDAPFATDLRARALSAWAWAQANPAVEFSNNQGAATGIGAGQQEVNAATRARYTSCLAVELFRLTGETVYRDYFDQHYADDAYGPLNGYVAAWDMDFHDYYLDYVSLPEATASVRDAIANAFADGMSGADNFGFLEAEPDAYMAYVSNGNYTWGSNAHKSRKGSLFYAFVNHELDPARRDDARRAAARYLHYLHGTNPLGLAYLSNMGEHGAGRSVTQFYHTWFTNGGPWDEVGVSEHGPAPGFLVGGPNPSYDWDGCCASATCSGCGAAPPSPPFGQPAQKSYLQFNDNWPLNSWSVTENSDGYQVAYIRLLSKFVR